MNYVEVYSILNLLGKDYIEKIPKSLYSLIEEKSGKKIDPKYKNLADLNPNNVEKSAISMIALIHLNYWCDTESEKNELKNIFLENQRRNEEEKRKKYNPDNIFKKDENDIEKMKQLVKVEEKESFLTKIIQKIKGFFYKK